MYTVKNLDELLVDGSAKVALTHFHDIPQNEGDGDLSVVTHTDAENKIRYTGVVTSTKEVKDVIALASPEKPVDATLSKAENGFTAVELADAE